MAVMRVSGDHGGGLGETAQVGGGGDHTGEWGRLHGEGPHRRGGVGETTWGGGLGETSPGGPHWEEGGHSL